MTFWQFVRERNAPALLGYALFTGMLSAGYYYNLTFVQLGLEQHIQIIDALAMLFFVAALILASFRRPAYQGTEGYS